MRVYSGTGTREGAAGDGGVKHKGERSMTHTPGPWREGKTADAIVADSPEGLPPYSYPEVLEHYGGYVVAESVAPCNKPLIMAAPDLLEACKAVLQYVDDHDSVVGAWGEIYEMLQKAVAKAEGRDKK